MAATRRQFLKGSGALAAAAAAPTLPATNGIAQKPADRSPKPLLPLSDYVNVLQGTHSNPQFSRGNTLPIVAEPFGMAHWTLESRGGSPWMFAPEDQRIQGFRCTHQLSPWLGDYGWSTIMPVTGEPEVRASARASSYRPSELVAHPYGFKMNLLRYGLDAELTPTCRGAVLRTISRHGEPISLLIDVPEPGAEFTWDGNKGVLRWKTSANVGGTPAGFATFYVLRVGVAGATFEQKELKAAGTGRNNAASVVGLIHLHATQAEIAVAHSFLSFEQAERNIDTEVGSSTFDAVQAKTKSMWEEHLSAVKIQGASEKQMRTFYSCLFRTLLFPRTWHEIDVDGKTVHMSPYTGKSTPGVMYADHGYWDVYRAWYPMMTLLYPEKLGEILQSWVNAGTEGEWMPQFPCPGYRACMTGSLIDSLFADAVVKDIPGFNKEAAYQLLKKHATQPGDPAKGYGRRGQAAYAKLGFVPNDLVEQACVESLDAHYGDFCIGQIATKLGHADDAAMFAKRSRDWRLLFDQDTKFFRGKNSDGSWVPNFREYQWGSPYVEGCAWQHRWSVPHEPEAMMEAFGGKEVFVNELVKCVEQEPRFEVGVYHQEIHEMSEMAAVRFGQYAHSNQPSHHILYMFTIGGRPDLTQKWVRRVLTDLYSPEDFCGDEDTGAMAAWYVLSSLGLYSLCPGKPQWMLGSPLWRSAEVRLGLKGKTVKIESVGDPATKPYRASLSIDGIDHSGDFVQHAELLRARNLRFAVKA
ncbi:alpha-1,2-mannosidase, putative [Terriglobus roseus DSM 18391]|uniref:Alpha-1,2-mannosidase, putative n=1 Tax=Terriglobus roseus (strain DSM 18391 / NRRL B-41598 / KBS 63) TaxID=926566 RepID=I3ZGE0_TERRK|nr:GH92 family glycosyl hydrolase [Terriglobus roseus]AFL88308.1 alpha-1,2-mannosidase, putative [Terriglobus roseus DSM 18391]AFL88649.1 alpha-1,2-mannosidase, putative [Terriglobus roseus DSM 18391]